MKCDRPRLKLLGALGPGRKIRRLRRCRQFIRFRASRILLVSFLCLLRGRVKFLSNLARGPVGVVGEVFVVGILFMPITVFPGVLKQLLEF